MSALIGSILILLIIASFVHHIGKKLHIPYTILLFILWLGLSYLIIYIPQLAILTRRSLTPELLFLVFLPVLLFEAWYNISYEQLSRNYLIIWWLAIIGVLISTSVIWFWWWYLLHILGRDIPLLVMILFGIIISSTDPVAVLSIFKHFGVPKRLYLIFEWESLFNDGTSVALFIILLWIIQTGTNPMSMIPQWILSFGIMVIWGILLWILIGVWFAELIKHIKYNIESEIALTMILPHTTFLLSEYLSSILFIWSMPIHISGVIATAFTAIIMGNYGKTKITPKVEKYMDKFWSFFSFVCNSLVFLMMGIMVKDISAPVGELLLPIGISILLVLIARAISVYLPAAMYNMTNLQKHLPLTYQHLLVWWSLRWALGLMLVLMIPDNLYINGRSYAYSIKEFILLLTVGTVLFSLIVQWLTIKKILKKINLDQLFDLEKFEKYEAEIYIYNKIINNIGKSYDNEDICKSTHEELRKKYTKKLEQSKLHILKFLELQQHPEQFIFKALSLHALGIEKQYLHEMYMYNEIPEHLFNYLDQKIERQILRVEKDQPQITPAHTKKKEKKKKIPYSSRDPIKLLTGWLQYTKHNQHDKYIINRTKASISQKVVDELDAYRKTPFGYDTITPILAISKLYTQFNEKAHHEIAVIQKNTPNLIKNINSILLDKWLIKKEEDMVRDLYEKEIITHKIYKQFMHEIEEEVLKTY